MAMFGTAKRGAVKLKQSASVAVTCVQVALTDQVKSLGVTFDSHLTNISPTSVRACYFHIRGLRHVRSVMSTDTAKNCHMH